MIAIVARAHGGPFAAVVSVANHAHMRDRRAFGDIRSGVGGTVVNDQDFVRLVRRKRGIEECGEIAQIAFDETGGVKGRYDYG